MVLDSVLKDLSSLASEAYDYSIVTSRNLGVFTPTQQDIIRNTKIALAGTGGNADILFTLVQLGFREFRIADPDIFEASNLNRQLGAYIDNLGCNKAHAVSIELRRIAPDAEIEVLTQGITLDNASSFIEGMDIAIDGIDIEVMHERKALFDSARARGIPVFTSPAIGFGAGLGVFDPVHSPSFEDFFGPIPDTGCKEWDEYILNYGLSFIASRPHGIDMQLSKERRKMGKSPAISIGCRVRASLMTTAIVGWLFHREEIPVVPTTLYLDILGWNMVKMGPMRRQIMKALVNRMFKESD
jgi:molybdopterin/thiamine biosynthesis adenylyltransferase